MERGSFLAITLLYKLILQAVNVGCIKLSFESAAESMIYKYNLHNTLWNAYPIGLDRLSALPINLNDTD